MRGAKTRVGMDRTKRRDVRWLIPLAALLSHLPAIAAGFIWLDHAHIEDRLALADPEGWLALFARGFAGTGFHRPLVALSLSVDAALGGGALLFHAVTLLWHAAASWLCALAAESLGLSRRAALWAALVFAVHPVTSLVANAIAFRSESMIAVALFSVVVFHTRGKALACALALFLGALCKETAIVLGPLFVVALELSPSATREKPLATRLQFCATAMSGLGVALGLRVAFAPAWRAAHPDLGFNEALGTRLSALTKSTLALVWPIRTEVCDAFAVSSLVGPGALAGLVILGGLCFLAYRRRGPALLLLFAILPSLQLVPVMRWWSPHYLYLPLAFAAMLVIDAVEQRAEMALRYAAPLITALGLLSLRDAWRYESDQTFWAAEVSAAPACREGHFYLATSAHAARRLSEAGEHYERALMQATGVLSYVDRDAALQNLAVVRLEQRRFAEAGDLFRAALELTADPAARRRLTHNLATAALGAGRPAEAADLLRNEVERPDALPASIFIRARAVAALGQKDEAAALLRRLPAELR
jgi:protein O-mannosyl-transferase